MTLIAERAVSQQPVASRSSTDCRTLDAPARTVPPGEPQANRWKSLLFGGFRICTQSSQVAMFRIRVQSKMFTTPEHAQKLLSANERIVRLTFADSQQTSLYVHPAFMKSCSSVLCDMLDALDSELHSDAYYSIPLSDTDVASWTAVLSMIHPSPEPFKIDWSNVMDLLLVAHKYDMPCITGEYKLPHS
jgi:hypothetical protein